MKEEDYSSKKMFRKFCISFMNKCTYSENVTYKPVLLRYETEKFEMLYISRDGFELYNKKKYQKRVSTITFTINMLIEKDSNALSNVNTVQIFKGTAYNMENIEKSFNCCMFNQIGRDFPFFDHSDLSSRKHQTENDILFLEMSCKTNLASLPNIKEATHRTVFFNDNFQTLLPIESNFWRMYNEIVYRDVIKLFLRIRKTSIMQINNKEKGQIKIKVFKADKFPEGNVFKTLEENVSGHKMLEIVPNVDIYTDNGIYVSKKIEEFNEVKARKYINTKKSMDSDREKTLIYNKSPFNNDFRSRIHFVFSTISYIVKSICFIIVCFFKLFLPDLVFKKLLHFLRFFGILLEEVEVLLKDYEADKNDECILRPKEYVVPNTKIFNKKVFLAVTDITDSTKMWNGKSNYMAGVMKHHDELARYLSRLYKGVECRNEGDSFLFAFRKKKQAADFALEFFDKMLTYSKRITDNITVRVVLREGFIKFRFREHIDVMGEAVDDVYRCLDHVVPNRVCTRKDYIDPHDLETMSIFCLH